MVVIGIGNLLVGIMAVLAGTRLMLIDMQTSGLIGISATILGVMSIYNSFTKIDPTGV